MRPVESSFPSNVFWLGPEFGRTLCALAAQNGHSLFLLGQRHDLSKKAGKEEARLTLLLRVREKIPRALAALYGAARVGIQPVDCQKHARQDVLVSMLCAGPPSLERCTRSICEISRANS
jgi:hypothetical protein